CARLGFAFW
nr:immunoglobulin heavy chain junction region [Mus musculus]MBK4185524.1 immunoglobulin heavy chain junction region [Mus musculus]MBK4187856.1 immunoglobulin heavy chain junction region [Mus musculus]MBK4187857.1 immunoglobulin heavy chain junction region [Mus musculus]MBK4187858.1 immunoglobulin heavy chain junction region [Mus musculus]